MIFIEVRCDKCGSVGLSRRCFYAHQMREELKAKGVEARCRGRAGLLPQVQATAKASSALTYDDHAGKQREKNGARLTGGYA